MSAPRLFTRLACVGRRSPPAVALVGLLLTGSVLLWDGRSRDSPAGAPLLPSDSPPAQSDLAARAAVLRRNGAYEEAAKIYADVSRAPNAPHTVRMAAAEAFLASGDARQALAMLDAANPAPPVDESAILRAAVLASLGDTPAALAALGAISPTHSLAGYAAFRAGELHGVLDDSAGALAAYETSLSRPLAALWRIVALRRVAALHVDRDDAWSAALLLERAATEAADLDRARSPTWYDGDLAQMSFRARPSGLLLDLGDAYLAAGQRERTAAVYQDLIARHPSTAEAREALNRLARLGLAGRVNGLRRGLVLHHAGEAVEAQESFAAFLAAGPPDAEAAEALFYQALARRNAGDRSGAKAALMSMAKSYPSSPLVAEALWVVARLSEALDTRGEAVAAHYAVWQAAPESELAARALFRAGWLLLWGGDAARARQTWEILGTRHPDPKARAQGLFWLGRGLLGLGEDQQGRATLTDATKAAPDSFDGIRARDLLEGGLGAEPFVRGRATAFGVVLPDENECIHWVHESSGAPSTPEASQARLGVIESLLASGLRAQALAESLDAIAAMASDPHNLYRFAAALERRGLYPVAIHGANQLARASPAGSPESAPRCLRRLMLPLAYADLVQDAARRHNLDPYVVLALLRQESWFGSHALSGAQARGLSQVTPPTAREIAGELGVTPFALDDLYRPNLSVSFGAWYLGRQVSSLGRRPILALAAYNGGPGNARRWIQGDMAIDPDDFVEAIDFPETRTYVRSIYETYTRYRNTWD